VLDLKIPRAGLGSKDAIDLGCFLEISQDTKKNRFITQFLGGLDAKSLGTAPMVANGSYWSNS
jgi:hypothetical protein